MPSTAGDIPEDELWPRHILDDPSKAPTVVDTAGTATHLHGNSAMPEPPLVDHYVGCLSAFARAFAEEFEEALLFGDHMDDIVVLRGGVQKLDQTRSMPDYLVEAAAHSESVKQFLECVNMEQDGAVLESLKGNIKYFKKGEELRSVYKDGQGREIDSLGKKLSAVTPDMQYVYLTELRFKQKYRHPLHGETTKTVLNADVKDYVGRDKADLMLYWDRCETQARQAPTPTAYTAACCRPVRPPAPPRPLRPFAPCDLSPPYPLAPSPPARSLAQWCVLRGTRRSALAPTWRTQP
jgi:hypothetical protein